MGCEQYPSTDELLGCIKLPPGVTTDDVMQEIRPGYVPPETRPHYILALRAQALDRVQELIQPDNGPWVDPPLPTQEQWDALVEAAFPPPPMA